MEELTLQPIFLSVTLLNSLMYIFLPGNYSLMSSFKCLLDKIQNKSWKGISNKDCIEQVGLWACACLWD